MGDCRFVFVFEASLFSIPSLKIINGTRKLIDCENKSRLPSFISTWKPVVRLLGYEVLTAFMASKTTWYGNLRHHSNLVLEHIFPTTLPQSHRQSITSGDSIYSLCPSSVSDIISNQFNGSLLLFSSNGVVLYLFSSSFSGSAIHFL